jgi:hypothetical protein
MRAFAKKNYNNFELNENYEYNKIHLQKVIGLITQSKDKMNKPIAFHLQLTLRVDEDTPLYFNPSRINKTLAVVLADTGYSYAWTIENAEIKGVHIHVMVIMDYMQTSTESALDRIFKVREAFLLEEGIKESFVPPRWTGQYFHCLESEYFDAIKRYCYITKVGHKQCLSVRSFGCSQVATKYRFVRNNIAPTKVAA